MGSNTPSDQSDGISGEELVTTLRFYWAFMDNDEYTYYWDKEDFTEFLSFDLWDDEVLGVSNCGPFIPQNVKSQRLHI